VYYDANIAFIIIVKKLIIQGYGAGAGHFARSWSSKYKSEGAGAQL